MRDVNMTAPKKNSAVRKRRTPEAAQPAPHPVSPQPISPGPVSPQPVSLPSYSVQGTLLLDTGSPAAGITVRTYNLGFAGADNKLGETQTDAQGNYSVSYTAAAGAAINLQVRALDPSGKEVTISNAKFNAQQQETLNLVVPASIQPQAATEFDRLSGDVAGSIGGIAALAKAEESATRQDLTLLSQRTNWDARLLGLRAIAVQQAAATGLGQDALYALYRMGMSTDPQELALASATTVQAALTKASKAGVVNLTDQQIAAAAASFQTFATKARLAMTAEGAVSSFGDLLPPPSAGDTSKFLDLYFSNLSSDGDLWNQAAKLGIPATTLDSLRLQGKFLYLTFNNAALAQKLQRDIGSLNNLSQLADKDYHLPDTWKSVLTGLAGSSGDQALEKLIPPFYTGETTADKLEAYAADLARMVRASFPEFVAARESDRNKLFPSNGSSASVSAFLRAAAPLGYRLGRTPLNAFLKSPTLPAMNDLAKENLKALHRLWAIAPSFESLQAALSLKFTSARDIASYTEDEFMSKFAAAFPSPEEATLVYRRAQMVSAVTFNFFTMAKQLDATAPVYALSASGTDRQSAKNAIVQQFPTMSSLFGNLDFCQCEDCRSVLSPAAYFVDLLDFLDSSAANPVRPATYVDGTGATKSVTPLDVLIGNPQAKIAGRRPDLGALPLTCENTNTAMPYIDLVNEIFEYYIANNNVLDSGAAYDTGSATTADLIAEPQHILPQVYSNNLKQAVYPLNLPFDLWIETVRGFLNYFKISLAQVLDTLRPAGNLELFTDVNTYPYYRAQILAESLGLSPAEYQVLTVTDPVTQKPSVQDWFKLYGYGDENTALNGQLDPTDSSQYLVPPLKSAKNLSQRLGLSYQELTGLVTTGFLNPGLYPLIFQFERFGISISDAFSYTGQPGYPALGPQQKAGFEALLDGITARYQQRNPASAFHARTWLANTLPPGYSKKVLVLSDPDGGCNFGETTLQYADGAAAQPLDFLKFNLFVRLWKKLGWALDETDRALQVFFPQNLPSWTDANFVNAFHAAWKTALVYLAHLDEMNGILSPAMGRVALLPFWSDLPVHGGTSLYSQLFLTPGVLNSDWAFDDPNGLFPAPLSDLASPPLPAPAPTLFSTHQATVQGVLGLTSAEIAAIFADAGQSVTTITAVVNGQNVTVPSFSLGNISICYRYSVLAKFLQMTVSDLISLKALSGLDPFQGLASGPLSGLSDDAMLNQTLAFLKQVNIVQNRGFTVEDLQYLLRHQFDPVGKYQEDANALMALVQSMADGLRQIRSRNTVPPDLASVPESLLDQRLSTLFPASLLQRLFAVLSNSQTYVATQDQVAVGIDATAFAGEPRLSLLYDSSTQVQTVSYQGLLLDWKKTELEQLNSSISPYLQAIQDQALAAFHQVIGDILGVWASLVQYEAVQTGVAGGLNPAPLLQTDPALSLSYDESGQLQWLGYRGVLTDTKKAALTATANSPVLLNLLNDVQGQAQRAHSDELIGSILAMWTSMQTFSPSQNAHDQAFQLFQKLATDLLTATVTAFDGYSQSFQVLNAVQQQRQVKVELVKVFLPLLEQKLSRQLALKTLAANLGSDASLIEALVTDAALLSDPSSPGESLLKSFLAISEQGLSASYYTSPTPVGAPQASGVAASADTADPSNSVPATGSCRFEGYLQVPANGPYRFFAVLGDTDAAASLSIDSPDPTALFKNPIISPSVMAAKAGDEVSQFVELKGGATYHFSVDFSNLGANGARLLVQGETLPKGALNQILLIPQQAVTAFTRAKILLSKVVQVLKGTGLDEREIRYMVGNAAQFGNLALSSLPTQSSDDSLGNAAALFSQFLALADYADLRKGPAGGTDGLIEVFQSALLNSGQEPNTPWTILANLTRRDPKIVRDVAAALGSDVHLQESAGVRRVWQVLQLVHILGISVDSLKAATLIVSPGVSAPEVIATSFKNAVQAQYTPETWGPIAQSVFDKLRQQKRDALAACLVHALGLQNSNQLFEHFLVDPGMEPVVQTSRLRLALSSVQTFVQRCLLNLENSNPSQASLNVAPGAIDADWWEWMKRYRVWQASREIFLFPENWMQPELRPDKTDLFESLESALLQGDVTSELVEDAFLDYLKGLDTRARLDIVAAYFDQNPAQPGLSTLHVLGRTYGIPHKYFYRTYSAGMWSAWQAVTPDIESDHIVLAVWKGRVNLFWVTFVPTAQPPDAISGNTFGDMANMHVSQAKAQSQVQVQLHWSEYFQGKWSNRISTDVKKSPVVFVHEGFDASSVYIHVSKEVDSDGNEPAVSIHLDFPDFVVERGPLVSEQVAARFQPGGNVIMGTTVNLGGGRSFRVTSKNCDPDFGSQYWQPDPAMPYDASGIAGTAHAGNGSLFATFANEIGADGSSTPETEQILESVNNFQLLTCANPVAPSPFLDANEPLYWDAGGLVSPFFYKDRGGPSTTNEATFFVQPWLTEKTVGEWEGWGIPPIGPLLDWSDAKVVDQIEIAPRFPVTGLAATGAADPVYSIYPMQASVDWTADPLTVVAYGNTWIGKNGGINATGAIVARPTTGRPSLSDGAVTGANGSRPVAGPLNFVGRQGLNPSQLLALKTAQERS